VPTRSGRHRQAFLISDVFLIFILLPVAFLERGLLESTLATIKSALTLVKATTLIKPALATLIKSTLTIALRLIKAILATILTDV
jgi:hypothetical protein